MHCPGGTRPKSGCVPLAFCPQSEGSGQGARPGPDPMGRCAWVRMALFVGVRSALPLSTVIAGAISGNMYGAIGGPSSRDLILTTVSLFPVCRICPVARPACAQASLIVFPPPQPCLPPDVARGVCRLPPPPPVVPAAHPQYANYWAPLTRKRHIPPHPAQPRHTNYWAPRTRKRHQQEHRPQRPTESSDPTQHAKGRTGDCPGPRKGATTQRNVTQGG